MIIYYIIIKLLIVENHPSRNQKWNSQDWLFCKKKKNIVSVWKAADLNCLAQGGQAYWSFLFSKASRLNGITCHV